MNSKTEILYGLKDAETLIHDIDDVLEHAFYDCTRDELPATVTVYEYERMKPRVDWLHTIERIYECLDEEYGNPEGGYTTEYPEAVKEAAKALAATIEQHYTSWMCEENGKYHEVDVLAWWDGKEASHD